MIRQCIECGKEFFTKKEGRIKYCSYACYYSHHKKDATRSYRLKQKIKPPKTEKKENPKPKRNITATCPFCGKSFSKRHYAQKFCSVHCRYLNGLKTLRERNNNAKPLQEKICPVCGKKFSTKKHDKVYCSYECYHLNVIKRRDIRRKKENEEVTKFISKEEKIANAKKAAEIAHKEAMNDRLEAKKLGLNYGRYIAWKGTEFLDRWVKQLD